MLVITSFTSTVVSAPVDEVMTNSLCSVAVYAGEIFSEDKLLIYVNCVITSFESAIKISNEEKNRLLKVCSEYLWECYS